MLRALLPRASIREMPLPGCSRKRLLPNGQISTRDPPLQRLCCLQAASYLADLAEPLNNERSEARHV